MKRTYDSVRPATAIPLLFKGKTIRAWGGPGKSTVEMDAAQWIPYQPASFPTPPFPDYRCVHSTYSAAGAAILSLWTGSNRFGDSVTLPAGSSRIEPGVTPAHAILPALSPPNSSLRRSFDKLDQEVTARIQHAKLAG
jgi:hypothetical protein